MSNDERTLTSAQRTFLRSPELNPDRITRFRIREAFGQLIDDLNLIFSRENLLNNESTLSDSVSEEKVRVAILNLAQMSNESTESVVRVLFQETTDCWTIPDGENIHGAKQELALELFVEAFDEYDPQQDETEPALEQLQNYESFKSVLDEQQNL